MKSLWNCPKHPDQSVAFICIGNVWHFEPLCNGCVPEHTKNHPKNIKLQLQGVKQVVQKALEIKQGVSGICEQRLKQCITLSEVPSTDFAYIKTLNERRSFVINEINLVFDSLIEDIRKKRCEQEKSQRQSLVKLIQSLEDTIKFFKKEQYPDIGEFCRQIKKYFFKDNLQVYVEEYDEVIQEYQQKTINYCPFSLQKDLPQKCSQLVKDLCKLEWLQQKIDKPQKQPQKKQPKKKEAGRRKCGRCRQQMQYLTEWKKHLICRNCGGKQRNYVKR